MVDMNAMQAALQRELKEDPTGIDDPKKRLLARLAIAEREYAEGRYRPAEDVIADLRAMNRA